MPFGKLSFYKGGFSSKSKSSRVVFGVRFIREFNKISYELLSSRVYNG